MPTIHPLSGEDSQVPIMRKCPGNKSTNASRANSTFLLTECQKMLDIPVIIDAYNQHKEGVAVADQYRTNFETQLILRCNGCPLGYWILETALINSLISYRDYPTSIESYVEHLWLLSLHCARLSPSWISINNIRFLTHSTVIRNHLVSSSDTCCIYGGPLHWCISLVGLIYNLSQMIVIPDSAEDASWWCLHAYKTYEA